MHCTIKVYNGMVKKMSENRIDPTVPGLFMVAFITLIFGVLGILGFSENAEAGNMLTAAMAFAAIIGVIFVVFTVSAMKVGNAFASSLFIFVAVSLFAATVGVPDGNYILIMLVAVFYIVFALIAFLVGAPKFLMILLFLVALLYLFVGLSLNATDGKAFALMYGIFGVLSALLALYMAFALSTQKLPVF